MGLATSAAAQRPVVQPLPPPEMADLRAALTRLASNPRDVDALINAGNASLLLEDIDAAIGFFGRAEVLDPGNPRVKLGLAGAYVVSRRPIEALRLFHEAEQGGADAGLFAAKRGLAFDLVGDNASAQAQYRLALTRRDDPRVREQLAISQAVAGDRKGFEATLLPLLKAKDMGAYRTRAFGLAILDREKEAVDLAKSVMPGALAQALTPYLTQIGDLSAVEQVAAFNLGVFPAAGSARGATVVAAQAPTRSAGPRSPPALPPEGSRLAPTPAPASATADRITPAGDPLGRAGAGIAAARVPASPARSTPTGGTRPAPLPTSGRILPATQPAGGSARVAPPRPDFGAVFAGLTPSAAATPAPGAVDVSRLIVPRERPVGPKPASGSSSVTGTPAAAAPGGKPNAASRARAAPAAKPGPKPGRPAPAEAKPAKPAHPARHWVQLAAGANRAALAFDWRRLSKAGGKILAGKEPFVVQWGRTNRLLTGPYPSEKAANEAVRALKAAGVDSLRYDSPEGQDITRLK